MRFGFAYVLLLASSWVCSAEQPPSSPKTPAAAEIHSAINESMKHYERFSFRVSFLESRIVRQLPAPPESISVTGNGEWSIVSDGARWKCVEKNFETKRTKTGVTTKDVVRRAGYDGKDYWHHERKVLYIGEKARAINRLTPKEVFWHIGSSSSSLNWLKAILTKYDTKISSIHVNERLCWKVESLGRSHGVRRRFELVVSPTQSWLPLSTTIEVNGEPHARETLSDLKSTADGVWYPTLIEFESPGAVFGVRKSRIQVTDFSTAKDGFADSEFEFDIPIDHCVMDYGKGIAWHNSPWWPDLAEFLRTEVGFPRKNPACFHDLRTIATNPEMNGEEAPSLNVQKWLNVGNGVAKPSAWSDRAANTWTIVYFFNGTAANLTSRRIHGLRSLKRHYPDAPLELIGIAASDASEEEVRRTIETLHIDFPIAIDTRTNPTAEDSSSYGQSHSVFGMRMGIVLVDPMQRIQFITSDSIKLLTNLGRFGTTHPEEPTDPLPDYRTTLEDYHRIEKRWLQLRKDAQADGSISGKISIVQGTATDRFDAVPAGEQVGCIVDLKLVPELMVASYNLPLGYDSFSDRSRTQEMQTDFDGEFEFTGLAKGRYELTISPLFGLAKTTKKFIVPAGDSKVDVGEIHLQQTAEISGVVVDENGQPVRSAKIVAVARHFDPNDLTRETNANLPSPQTTDEVGKFHFQGLHVGAYSFIVGADDYPEARQEPVAAGSKNVKLRVSRGSK